MPDTSKTRVLIVGAGPVGLTMALELTRYGVPVRVVDKSRPRPETESRALGTFSRTLETFERLGALEPMLREGLVVHGFSFYAGDGTSGEPIGRLGLEGLDAPHPTLLMLGQASTERILTERLERLGVLVERPVEIVALRQDTDAVHATLRGEEGRCEEVSVPYLVGADGAHSTVRKAVNADFPGTRMQGQYLVDARVGFTGGEGLPGGEGHLSLSPKSLLVFGRLPGGLWRVIVSLQQDDPRMRRETPTLELMQSLVDEHPWLGARLHDITWASAFFISNRMVDRMRFGRVFLAGDAAHIHSPVGGQGMNNGVADAANLAWKLALALRGFGGEDLLDSYDAERRPIIARLLKTTEASEHALMLRNPLAIRGRNVMLSVATRLGPFQAYARRWLAGFQSDYRGSPVVAEDGRLGGGPKPGDRAPDGLVCTGGEAKRLFEVLSTDPRHHLLVFAGLPNQPRRVEELGRLVLRVERRYGALIKAYLVTIRTQVDANLLDRTGGLHRRYGARSERLYLVRPDGHVAFRGLPGRDEELFGYLDRTLAVTRVPPHRHPDTALPTTGVPREATVDGQHPTAGSWRMGRLGSRRTEEGDCPRAKKRAPGKIRGPYPFECYASILLSARPPSLLKRRRKSNPGSRRVFWWA